ncbi:MAG TPA: dihydrolipoyllysine-residue acetyltransferase [Burkholderiales bacterium]|nr:dihydrolipoyllysine-residue acetyltransferase [Burkholderiales bacterium]
MGAMQEVRVPDIGDFKDVDVIEILVKPGDTVAAEQSLVSLESDKATMEIPSPSAGVVKELRIKVGDKVSEGTPILMLEAGAAVSAAPGKPAPAGVSPAAAAPAAAPTPTVAAPRPETGGAARRVDVPDIGDFKDVEVIEILVKPGDTVAAEQSLVSLESDKATMEVPSPAAGVVKELLLKVGDKVSQGAPILVLAEAGTVPAGATAPQAPAPSMARTVEMPIPARTPPVQAEITGSGPTGFKPHASPSVRKFARELGVDLARVTGTGPKGRIVLADVQAFVKGALARGAAAPAAPAVGGLAVLPWPQVDFAKFGPIETQALSRIKKISGANLHRNWVMIPHVTNNDVADITDLEALRVQLNKENEKSGVKLTMLAFLIKASVAALKKHPEFNSSLDGDNLVLKRYYHIGFAADTPNGLMVPVIKDADRKGIMEVAKESGELAKQAREGKLKPADMQGGTFSISSLGGIGGTSFTPIINAPEVAILGVSRSSQQPVWDGKNFVPRLMLPLSLSYDHRVIDGALAARFNAYLAQLLADFRRAML